ncbi:Inosose dehydratase [Trichinella spiralis]|uniref:Inosose dehydratase n=1 Tax=Trichinella spiralis TaxID=6334 RepID=A0ABR3KXI1_TRISP
MSTFVPPPQVRVLQRQLRQYEKFYLMNQGVSLPVLMRSKITFRHPVEGEDCSHVYVEHCHQLRHVHLTRKPCGILPLMWA